MGVRITHTHRHTHTIQRGLFALWPHSLPASPLFSRTNESEQEEEEEEDERRRTEKRKSVNNPAGKETIRSEGIRVRAEEDDQLDAQLADFCYEE